MKLICYALFNGNAEPFEKMAYLRGFYFNCRMNNFIYPDWRTHLEVDRAIYSEFKTLFDWLVENNNLSLNVNENTPALCEGMLWRMKPMFYPHVTHILCRDCDSITTYREAGAVQRWLESGLGAHAINDNAAHGGLMGGMVGFNTAQIKAIMGWNSWEDLVARFDLSQRGSDQNLLNYKMGPVIKDHLMLHKFAGSGLPAAQTLLVDEMKEIPQVNYQLWQSNLTCRHIGSPGVVELETLRFFKRFDPYNWKFMVAEKMFPQVFYWHSYGEYNWRA